MQKKCMAAVIFFFFKKFRQINVLLKNFTINWFDGKKIVWQQHTVEKREILFHRKNISSNQLFSNLFTKTVTFTEFLLKMREREFP